MPLIWGWLFIVCLLFGQHSLFAQASQNICNVLNGRGMELLLALGLAAYRNCLCSQGSTMVPCLLAVASLEMWGLLKMPCNLSCKIVTASVLCFRPVDFQIVVLKDFFFSSQCFLFNLPEAYLSHLTSDHLFWFSGYQEFLLQKATKSHFEWDTYFKLKHNNGDMESSSKMSPCTMWRCRSFMMPWYFD